MTDRSATVIVWELPDAECKITDITMVDHDLISALCSEEMHQMLHSSPLCDSGLLCFCMCVKKIYLEIGRVSNAKHL